MPPVFGALTKEFKETVFSQTVDIFRHSRFAEQLGVRAIPTVLFVRAGREIERFEGPVSERTLRYYLRRVPAEHTGGPLPGAEDGVTARLFIAAVRMLATSPRGILSTSTR